MLLCPSSFGRNTEAELFVNRVTCILDFRVSLSQLSTYRQNIKQDQDTLEQLSLKYHSKFSKEKLCVGNKTPSKVYKQKQLKWHQIKLISPWSLVSSENQVDTHVVIRFFGNTKWQSHLFPHCQFLQGRRCVFASLQKLQDRVLRVIGTQ